MEVDEKCNEIVQDEGEKQLIIFEKRQNSREQAFREAMESYKRSADDLTRRNEEFFESE